MAGEIVLTDRAAELLQHLARLALGVQGFTRSAAKDLPPEHGLDPVPLVLVGNRRQAHDLPLLLGQYMAGEVVLVQPVHDQDYRARALVVEAAVERMVEPFVRRPPLGLRQCLIGL